MFALFSYFDFPDANNWNKYLPDFLQKLQEQVDHAAASGNQDDEAKEQRKEDSEAAVARTSPVASQLARRNVQGEPSSASAAAAAEAAAVIPLPARPSRVAALFLRLCCRMHRPTDLSG